MKLAKPLTSLIVLTLVFAVAGAATAQDQSPGIINEYRKELIDQAVECVNQDELWDPEDEECGEMERFQPDPERAQEACVDSGENIVPDDCVDAIFGIYPVLEEVSMESNNAKVSEGDLAKAGDNVTVTMRATDSIHSVSVSLKIDGRSQEGSDSSTRALNDERTEWEFNYTVVPDDNGLVEVDEIHYEWDDSGRTAVHDRGTMDSSSVDVITTPPGVDELGYDGDALAEGEEILLGEQRGPGSSFTLTFDLDLSGGLDDESEGSYQMEGVTEPTVFDLDDSSFDVPVFRGELTVMFDLEDEVGNRQQDTFNLTILPATTLSMSVFEDGDPAVDDPRYFGDDTERNYTVSLVHQDGEDDGIGSVVIDFSNPNGMAVDLLEMNVPDLDPGVGEEVIEFYGAEGQLESIELDPYFVQDRDGPRQFNFKIQGDPIMDGEQVDINLKAYPPDSDSAVLNIDTHAVGDATPPDIGNVEFQAANGDGVITREEWEQANKEIILDVTVEDDGSGLALLEVRRAADGGGVADSTVFGPTITELDIPLNELSPGLNELTIVAYDKVGNKAEETVEVIIEIEQRLIVTPGIVFIQSNSDAPTSGTVEFNLTREDFAEDEVDHYRFRAIRDPNTNAYIVSDYDDIDQDVVEHEDYDMGSTGGMVSLVRYFGDVDLDVEASIEVPAGMGDGRNDFNLNVSFENPDHDVRVVDENNETYEGPVFTVVVDNTQPELDDVTANRTLLNSDQVKHGFNLEFNVTEKNPYRVTVKDENGNVVGTGTGTGTSDESPVDIDIDTQELDTGEYEYTVDIVDAAGNEVDATQSVTITVDTDPPVLGLEDVNGVDPSSGTLELNATTAGDDLVFNFTATDVGEGVDHVSLFRQVEGEWVQEAVNNNPEEGNLTIGLPDDTNYPEADHHVFRLVATDGANNNDTSSESEVTIRLDTASPNITFDGFMPEEDENGTIDPDEENGLTFRYNATDGTGSGIKQVVVEKNDQGQWSKIDPDSEADDEIVIPFPPYGEHEFRLKAEDNSGNIVITDSNETMIGGEVEILLDVLTQDTQETDGTLGFDELGDLEWDFEITGTLVPGPEAGCPCSYELDLVKDVDEGAAEPDHILHRDGTIEKDDVVTEVFRLTGEADGDYTATVRLVNETGVVLASDEGTATIAVQPVVTGFAAILEGVDIANSTRITGSDSTHDMEASFSLDANRALLESASLVNPPGFARATPGTFHSTNGLEIPLNEDGSAAAFTLFLDRADSAPHPADETFTLDLTGIGGLEPIFTATSPKNFTFVIDKEIDTLSATAQRTDDVATAVVSYEVQDEDAGLEKLELFVNDNTGSNQTIEAFDDNHTMQTGEFAPVEDLPDGTHEFTVVATDNVGNEASVVTRVNINEHAEATLEILEGETDRMGGELIVPEGGERDFTLRATNPDGNPTIASTTISLSGNDSIVLDATNYRRTTTGSDGNLDSITFDLNLPGGESRDVPFTLKGVDNPGSGDWEVMVTTENGFTGSEINNGVNGVTIRTADEITPDMELTASQNDEPLEADGGLSYAAAHSDGSGDSAVTIDVAVTHEGEPVRGLDVDLNLGFTATTNETGVAVFTIDPDAFNLNYRETELVFSTAAGEHMVGGELVVLQATQSPLDLIWTGFYVHLEGDEEAGMGSTPAEVTATLYWLHDVLVLDDGDIDTELDGKEIDTEGATPIDDEDFDGTISLIEDVGAAAGLTMDEDGLEAAGAGMASHTFNLERGDVLELEGAGYRKYTGNLSGEMPLGLPQVFESGEHMVLFSAVRLVLEDMEQVAFVGEDHPLSLRAQWLHTQDFDGNPVDRFDLQDYSDITLGIGSPGTDPTLASDTNLAALEVPAEAGESQVSLTGTWGEPFEIHGASVDLLGLEIALTSGPQDATLDVDQDYEDAFTLEINGMPVTEGFTLDDSTLETVIAGETPQESVFQGSLVDVHSDATVLFGTDPVNAQFSHTTSDGTWEITIPDPSPGPHSLELDIEVGSFEGETFSTHLERDFMIKQNIFVVSLEEVTGASDDSDLQEIWAERDATPTLEFGVDKGVWDGEGFSGTSDLAADGVVVELWADEGNGWQPVNQTTVQSGVVSFQLEGFQDDAAGVKDLRAVVIEDEAENSVQANEGQNRITREAETSVIFSGLSVTFADAGPATAQVGDTIGLGFDVSYDHNGEPAAGTTVSFSATGIGSVSSTTDSGGEGVLMLTRNSKLKADDLEAAVSAGHHGLGSLDVTPYDGVLRWVEVKVNETTFETSSDGSQFEPEPGSDGEVTVPTNTYVKVITSVVLDDGTETPLPVDGGVIEYGSRSIGLDETGEGSRVYFSSQEQTLQAGIEVVSTTFDGDSFAGGTGGAFSIVWTSGE